MVLNMKMKTLVIGNMLLASYAGNSQAIENIAQCIDEQGNITYTDVFCITTVNVSPSQSLGTTSASYDGQSPLGARSTNPTISPTRLSSVTDQALSECSKEFSTFFRRKHPTVSPIPDVLFNNIVDQYMKGSNISISLSGEIEYSSHSQLMKTNVECTVQKLQASNEWMIGFQER